MVHDIRRLSFPMAGCRMMAYHPSVVKIVEASADTFSWRKLRGLGSEPQCSASTFATAVMGQTRVQESSQSEGEAAAKWANGVVLKPATSWEVEMDELLWRK